MNNVRILGTYLLLVIALVGCFWLIGFSRGDEAVVAPFESGLCGAGR